MVYVSSLLVGLLLLPSLALANNEAGIQVLLETGAAWQNRNDVRIAPDTGSYVEFDQYNQGPFLHYRAEVFYQLNKRHGFRLLYAPFSVSVTGAPEQNILFDGLTFLANQPLNVDYQFNSYRLSYRYLLVDGSEQKFYIGFTGKIRDARIRFSQNGVSEEFTNVGFVPLFYFFYQARLAKTWFFTADLDAAAASQGRAIDLALKFRNQVIDNGSLGFGLRTLEGGADNDTVFTFSWFNYAVVDFSYQF